MLRFLRPAARAANGHDCTIPALLGGAVLMGAVLASPGAQAQCVGSLNAVSTVIGTVNTAFLSSGSAFVSAPESAPDKQAGGIWVRTVSGTVTEQADSNLSTSFTVGLPQGSITIPFSDSCRLKIQQDFTGVQAGHDIAVLNTGASGMNWHFGVLAGYVGVNAKDLTAGSPSYAQTGTFDVPSAGVYTAFSKGNFYADAQARLDYFQGESVGQRLDAHGYSVSGNAGYRFDLGSNWSLEPSVGGIYSSTAVNQLSLYGQFGSLGTYPATMQIQDVESALGRASIKLRTSVALDSIGLVAYPFVTASVFHEFANGLTASVTSSGIIPTGPYAGASYLGGGVLTVGRVGTYSQFGAGSAFQFAGTDWLGYARMDYRTGENIDGYSFSAGLRYQLNPGTASLKEGGSLKDSPSKDYNWTGPYAGAYAGSAWGSAQWSNPSDHPEPDYAGYLAGGEAGYNYQTGRIVWGVEADAGGSNARGGKTCTGEPNTYSCNADLKALGALTGRLGYTWGRALFYAKGGWAFGEAAEGMHLNYGASASALQPATSTEWQNGWTAGGGMEFALTDSWSAKAEYMHYELSPESFTVAQNYTASVSTEGDVVRVGVNYHFGR